MPDTEQIERIRTRVDNFVYDVRIALMACDKEEQQVFIELLLEGIGDLHTGLEQAEITDASEHSSAND